MKATDFRVGNLIKIKGDAKESYRIFAVDGLNEKLYLEMPRNNWHEMSKIKPIELTEEWLLKMGFQANGQFYTINVFDKDERFDIDLKGWIGFNNMVAECNINTVHKLQNLYHALTGEELTIK